MRGSLRGLSPRTRLRAFSICMALMGGLPGIAAGQTATFVREDRATQGKWKGVYGLQGGCIMGELNSAPPGSSFSFSNQSAASWGSTNDVRGLQKFSGADNTAPHWYTGTSFDINVTAPAGGSKISIYCLDWDWYGRKQRVDVIDPATNTVLDSRSLVEFTGGVYLSWNITGSVKFRVVNKATNAVVSGFFMDPITPPVTESHEVVFVGEDRSTQGTWKGVYGNIGRVVSLDHYSPPPGGAFTVDYYAHRNWVGDTMDVRALQKDAGTSRIAPAWESTANSSVLSFTLPSNAPRQAALYCLDWDHQGRKQRIDVIDAVTGDVVDTRLVENFADGVYLKWEVSGSVRFRITPISGPSAVVSAMFVDEVGARVDFAGVDRTTKGNWKGGYGKDGGLIAGDDYSAPAYGHISLSGNAYDTWQFNSTDERSPLRMNYAPRVAGTFLTQGPGYTGEYTMDVVCPDQEQRRVSLYCLDWDNAGRSQTIEIRDANTGVLLDSRQLSDMWQGVYLRWNISGHVKIKVLCTGPVNAVVSAVFFDPASDAPSWWSVGQPVGSGNPPVLNAGRQPENHGIANIGQAKWMAKSALESLRAVSPALAEEVEKDLVGPGKPIVNWKAPSSQAAHDSQRAPLLLKQLKRISQPFYDNIRDSNAAWLLEQRVANGTVAPLTHLPWSATTDDDADDNISPATIGQLKAVFAFRYDRGVDGPLARWKLDEKTGSVLQESVTGGNPITTSGTTPSDGLYGQGGQIFDGTNDTALGNANKDYRLNAGNEDFSASLWFKTTSTGTRRMLSKGQAYWLSTAHQGNGTVTFAVAVWGGYPYPGAAIVGTVNTFNDGKWHHVAGICDQTNKRVRIYVDGVIQPLQQLPGTGGTLVESNTALDITPIAPLYASGDSPLTIGNAIGPAEFFAGELDDVRIYNRALDAASVRNLHDLDENGNGVPDRLETDTDHDGIPDPWEVVIAEHNPSDSITGIGGVSPYDDYDNDGYTNFAEFQSGSNPTDPFSFGTGPPDKGMITWLGAEAAKVETAIAFSPDYLALVKAYDQSPGRHDAAASPIPARYFPAGGYRSSGTMAFVEPEEFLTGSASAPMSEFSALLFMQATQTGSSSTQMNIVSGSAGSGALSLSMDPTTGYLKVMHGTQTVIAGAAGTRLVRNQHYTVAYTFAAGTGRLYLNGALVAQNNTGVTAPSSAPSFKFGGATSTAAPNGINEWRGSEVLLYNRALSADEIARFDGFVAAKYRISGDSDRDGLDDAWELKNFGNLAKDGTDVPDNGGLVITITNPVNGSNN